MSDLNGHLSDAFYNQAGLKQCTHQRLSKVLHALHQRYQTSCSSFVSASNPFSQEIGDKANARLHAELMDGLTAQGFNVLDGFGCHSDNQWPGEKSCLIFGSPESHAVFLAKRSKQHAVVCADQDAIPRLVVVEDHRLSVDDELEILDEHVKVLERSIRAEDSPASTVQTMVRRQRLHDAMASALKAASST